VAQGPCLSWNLIKGWFLFAHAGFMCVQLVSTLNGMIVCHGSTKVPYGAMAAQMLVLSLQLLHLTGVSGVACFSSRLCQTAQLLFALLLLVQSHRDTMFDMCL